MEEASITKYPELTPFIYQGWFDFVFEADEFVHIEALLQRLQTAHRHRTLGTLERVRGALLELIGFTTEKFAPQYGGYCAFAVAHKGLSPGDPRHWRIVDGKLYLNVDASVQTRWNKDHVAFIKRGDDNWPRVLK